MRACFSATWVLRSCGPGRVQRYNFLLQRGNLILQGLDLGLHFIQLFLEALGGDLIHLALDGC